MELKSRQSYILRHIMDAPQAPQADSLLRELGIARRTLYYDIDKINDWLAQGSWGRVEIRGRQLKAHLQNRQVVASRLARGDSYFYSIQERRAMEILFIALSSESITINKLMDSFQVSKNTILGDIKAIKGEMERFSLELSSTMRLGYIILGEEAAVRKMIWTQLQVLSTSEAMSMVSAYLQSTLVALTKNDVDYFELCRCLIKQYGVDIGGGLQPDIQMESMMIQVSWIRSHKGHIISMSSDEEAALMNTLSYRSVELSLQKLKRYEMIIHQQEIYYITSLFLGIMTTDFTTQEQENLYIGDISEKLINSFERVACLSFASRERLHKQLSHHIRPMYYRLKYGIAVKNPLVKDIFRMYPVVGDFTRRALEDVQIPLLEGISEDELAYLCVYFASSLNEKYAQKQDFTPKNVLIIGPENMATATLVREQLEHLFGLSFRYSVISAQKVREWILGDYALVVSLAPVRRRFQCDNLVEIDPILGEADQKKIVEVLKGNSAISRYNSLIADIIQRVERNISGTLEADRLYLDLIQYFCDRDRKKSRSIAPDTFTQKVNTGDVEILPQGMGWEDAVIRGSAALSAGQGNGRLDERMDNLLQHKRVQFYRMHPNAVLVHCPMQGDVDAQSSVSIQLSPDGVDCPDGQRAEILVFLSTINHYAHWNLLKTIYQYFDVPVHVEGLRQMVRKANIV